MASSSLADPGGDTKAILQLVLDDPKLAQYYHFDVRPERLPLKIVNRTAVPIDTSGLTAKGQATAIVSGDADKALEVLALSVAGDHAEIEIAFRAEGVRGKGTFRRGPQGWSTETLSIAERS